MDMKKRGRSSSSKAHHIERARLLRAVCLIVVGLLLAVPIPFANTVVGYLPLGAYIFTMVVCCVYARILRRGLVYEQKTAGDGCLRGEKIAFELAVGNPTPLPAVSVEATFFISNLFGGELESVHQRISLPPHSSKSFNFAVSFVHIGEYQVGISKVKVADPFGVFSHAKENSSLASVYVQPRTYEIASFDLSTEAALESKKSAITVINDGMDYCGVREYRPGDPMKAVHWKLSASAPSGEYYTRLYETTCNPGLEVLIDFDSLPYGAAPLMDIYDAIVESALSIEAWGSRLGLETGLLFVDTAGQTKAINGPLSGQYAQLLPIMPRIKEGNGRDLIDILSAQASSIYAQNNLIVCSACITDELIGALMSVRSHRKTPILVAVVPKGADDEVTADIKRKLGRLSDAKIVYRLINAANDLEKGM